MKIMIAAILLCLAIFQNHSFAGIGNSAAFRNSWSSCSAYPGCANNSAYYGQAAGYVPPVYFYPQLPYQSMWPQQNYYFPHTQSPYQPSDCPWCNQMQNYQQQQPMFFPNSYQMPGGGIT